MVNPEQDGKTLVEGEVTPEVEAPAEAVTEAEVTTEAVATEVVAVQEPAPVETAPPAQPVYQVVTPQPTPQPVQQTAPPQPTPPPVQQPVTQPIYGYTQEGVPLMQPVVYGQTPEGLPIYGYTPEGQPVTQPIVYGYMPVQQQAQATYSAPQAPKVPVGQQFQQVMGNVAKNPMVGSAVSDVKGLISKTPEEAIKKSGEKTDLSWVLSGVIGVILSGVLFLMFVPGLISGISGGYLTFGDTAPYLSQLGLGGVTRFMVGFVYKAFDIAATTALVAIPMFITKKKFSFMRSANAVVMAMWPSFLLYVFAIVLCLFWANGAVVLVLAGVIISFVIMYQSILYLGEFEKTPTWAMSAYFVAVALVRILLVIIIDKALGNSINNLL